MPECNDSRVGSRLGKYRFTGRLGQGGMGVVYAAEDTVLKRRVAVKLLPEAVAADPEARRRFLREGQAAARLAHPNVVTVHEADERDGVCYLVMELVAGGSAQDLLRTRGALPLPEATRLLADACRGLAAAHAAGLIHRDIKPANLMRAADGAGKLADFGLARTVVADGLSSTGPGAVASTLQYRSADGLSSTATGAVMGTPHYMSPEQCRGEPLDARTDLYALGATYYALLTGRPPYQRDDKLELMFAHCSQPVPDPRAGRPEVPEGCAAVVRRAMAKYPAERYPSAAEMLAELEALLAAAAPKAGTAPAGAIRGQAHPGPPPAALPLTPPATQPAPQGKRWRPRVLLTGGVVALVVLLGVEGFFNKPPQADPDKGTVKPTAADDQAFQYRSPQPDTDKGAVKPTAPVEKPRWAGPLRDGIAGGGVEIRVGAPVFAVAFSPDGKWLAAGSWGMGVKVWDCATCEQRFSRWQTQYFECLVFSPDSRTLAAGSWGWPERPENSITLLELATGQERKLALGGPPEFGSLRWLHYTPAGRILAGGLDSKTGKASFWETEETGAVGPAFTLPPPLGRMRHVAFSPDGKMLATSEDDGQVKLWEWATRKMRGGFRQHPGGGPVAFSPDGKVLVAACGGALEFWDFGLARRTHSVPKADPIGFGDLLVFSPDSKLLATATDTCVDLWLVFPGKKVQTQEGHTGPVRDIVLPPEGDVLARPQARFPVPKLQDVAFSPDGDVLAAASLDRTVLLWDVSRFREEK